MITDEQTITSEAVAAWMKQQLATCISITPTGPTCFDLRCSNFGPAKNHSVGFECYNERLGHTGSFTDPEKAFEKFRTMAGIYSPELAAKRKREQAAALLAEAEKLESETK